MPIVTCRILGPMQVTVDDLPAPSPLLWNKPLGLLVYLLRSPRRTRSREQLVGLLWPDVEDGKAKHSLNVAFSSWRRAAGEDAIESSGDLVVLGPQFRCDVDDFEAAMARGDWAAAAGLSGGEFAEGLAIDGAGDFDLWLEGERRHWRGQGVLALCAWAQHSLDRGHTRAALEASRRALALDPLSDRAAQATMRSLLLLGDRRGALETGRELVQRLASELAAAPADETRELLRQAEAGGSAALEREPDAATQTPLVGRETELSSLVDLFTRARATREAVVAVVTGEPGIGVSRLVKELADRARLAGASVARAVAVAADCDEEWSGVTGLALGGLLAAPGIAGAPPASLGALATRLVPWRDRFAATMATGTESLDVALGEVVAAAADERPVVLVLDDAHRLDEATLRALPRLLRRWRELPVLVVIGASPLKERESVDELRVAAGRDQPGLSLQLRPLTVTAIRELAAAILPSYSAAQLDRIVRRVVTDSAGLPLLAREVLLAVSRGLELSPDAKAWPATSATLEDSLPGDLPDAIIAAVRVNFRLLSREGRDVLAAAAIIAERVDVEQLVRGTALPRADVERALDELEWNRWLTVDGRGYSFVAPFNRRVVGQEMLTAGQRRRILDRMRGPGREGGSEGR